MNRWILKRTEGLIPFYVDGKCNSIWFYLNWIAFRTIPNMVRRMRILVPDSQRHQQKVTDDARVKIDQYAASSDAKRREIVVYTAIMGGYDSLIIPQFVDPDIDYVCFTDGTLDGHGLWQIRKPPYIDQDKTRMARYVKTHPINLFPEHRVAIWIDANILVKGNLKRYVQAVLDSGRELGVIPHPFRDCTYDEAKACRFYNRDSHDSINLQMDYYRSLQFPEHFGLFETGVLVAVLQSETVREFFRIWWEQIRKFSKRDQLSVGYAMWNSGIVAAPLMDAAFSVRNHPDFALFRHSR